MERVKNFKLTPAMVLAIVWVGVFCGSLSGTFVRWSTAPALVLAAYRKTMVTVMMLPLVWLKYREELLHIGWKKLGWSILSGCFLGMHFWTYFTATQTTTLAAAQVLAGTEVLYVAAFMYLTGKEKPTKMCLLGICLALAGGVCVAWVSRTSAVGVNPVLGNASAIVCAIVLAAYVLIGARVRENCSTTVYTFIVYGSSAVFLNLMVLVTGTRYFGYGAVNYLTAFCMAIFASFLGHSIMNWAVKYVSPTMLAMFKIFAPVFAATCALVFFGELPAPNQIIGGIVVLAGILIYCKGKGN